MKKYISFLKLRCSIELQYRTAALAGLITQFFWGGMLIMTYRAFYETDPTAFPMTLSATCSYIWLQQAFFALYQAWSLDNDILDSIVNGNVAYELCRPTRVYFMWFARTVAGRASKAALRCLPIIIFSALLPKPYGLSLPASAGCFLLYLVTTVLSLIVISAFCMLIYVLAFFTVSPMGLKIVFSCMVEFFAGAVIPLPFFPDRLRRIMELLPFASMQNVPLRVYSGDLSGGDLRKALILQLFWAVTLVAAGFALSCRAEKKVTLQGG